MYVPGILDGEYTSGNMFHINTHMESSIPNKRLKTHQYNLKTQEYHQYAPVPNDTIKTDMFKYKPYKMGSVKKIFDEYMISNKGSDTHGTYDLYKLFV